MAIKWNFKKTDYKDIQIQVLPTGIYEVKIESAEEAVSPSGNQMIKMVLRVAGHKNKVKHHLTFSPQNRNMVNKALSDIYCSFNIPAGNLEPKEWIGHIGTAMLEEAEYNGSPYNCVAYFIKPQAKDQQPDSIYIYEDDNVDSYWF